jgi:hypothetical protein
MKDVFIAALVATGAAGLIFLFLDMIAFAQKRMLSPGREEVQQS